MFDNLKNDKERKIASNIINSEALDFSMTAKSIESMLKSLAVTFDPKIVDALFRRLASIEVRINNIRLMLSDVKSALREN